MLYKDRSELPLQIQKSLPFADQDEYLKIFNSAWEQYKDDDSVQGRKEREITAHQVAWDAVSLSAIILQK